MELTSLAEPGGEHRLVLRVDDSPHPFKLEGKQGYGPARGLWQTVYLEARPAAYLESFELRPDLESEQVEVRVRLADPAASGTSVALELESGAEVSAQVPVPTGEREARFVAPVVNPRLWSLEDPYLYAASVLLRTPQGEDRVKTYLGMREISTARLPGLGHPYVALNGKPVYLQMTLDQGWHPEGFTTWPSDAAMREEILIARRLGLNAIRTHVKIEPPRKLYWADRLGVLVMADVPNSWGEPDSAMREEWETAFRGMVRRDFNHPSIFSWVLFNETWGLHTKDAEGNRAYLPETQAWVASQVDMAKELDATRLVEDNSVCCGVGHVKTDLNTWHAYLPGWKWRDLLDEAEENTFPGSEWNYQGGRTQGEEPMLNSECGNVWGYEGSTGDVDWSFDYHAMINEFRRHPKVAGWLYTEHHDVINEWNGYVRADRSAKETGLGALVPGMSLRDLHTPYYVVVGSYPTTAVPPGETVPVPLWASFLTGESPGTELTIRMLAKGALRAVDVPRARADGGTDAVAPRGGRPAPRARRSRGPRPPPQLHRLRGWGHAFSTRRGANRFRRPDTPDPPLGAVGVLRRPLEHPTVGRDGRSQGQRRRLRCLRVSHPVARRPEAGGGGGGHVRGRARGQAALR
jgi:hypothetical protein